MAIPSKRKSEACHTGDSAATHPNHRAVLPRLKRARGQLEGIERMIEEGRYCVDILVQFRAVMAALRNAELEVFERHLKNCVEQALRSRDSRSMDQKVEELVQLLTRRTQI